MEENLNYSAEALRKVFRKYYPTPTAAAEHARQPSRIASRVYADRMGNGDEASGDGWAYRGRGLIQLTGRNNYRGFSDFIGEDCEADPDLVKARYPVQAATYYWVRHDINRLADRDDVKAVTKAINGGLNGFDDRLQLTDLARTVVAANGAPVPALTPTHRVAASALNLRSRPKISPTTLIATLPQGIQVERLGESVESGWAIIRALLNTRLVEGVVAERFLSPLTTERPTLADPALVPPAQDIPRVHLKENRADVSRQRDGGRAYPLGEAGRPTRNASTAAERARQLNAIVDYLDAENRTHLRWWPKGGTTFCNIYAYDYACLAGVYLPRVWWTDAALEVIRSGTVPEVEYGVSVREMNANMLYDWLDDYGQSFGWQREADPTVLQAAANNGDVCVIVGKRVDTNRPGHISVVVPEHGELRAARDGSGAVVRPLQSQAGRQNFRYSAGRTAWWQADTFEFFAFWRRA